MEKVNINDEFRKLHDQYKKNYGSQKSFRSLRQHKDTGEPVFYIGVPGIGIALAMTFITAMTVALLSMSARWYVWVVYVIIAFAIFRFSIKYDKVRQIRFMVASLLTMGMTMIDQANDAGEHSEKHEKYKKAKHFLDKASEWVEEPALAEQIAELERILL